MPDIPKWEYDKLKGEKAELLEFVKEWFEVYGSKEVEIRNNKNGTADYKGNEKLDILFMEAKQLLNKYSEGGDEKK